jgi:hypothetical protein
MEQKALTKWDTGTCVPLPAARTMRLNKTLHLDSGILYINGKWTKTINKLKTNDPIIFLGKKTYFVEAERKE